MKIQTTKIYSEIDSAMKAGYTTVSLQGSSRSSKTYNALIWLIVYCLNHVTLSVNLWSMQPGEFVSTRFETGWNPEIIREIQQTSLSNLNLKWGY